ncbi:MAG: hypothetical protein J5I90_22015 [Caldilineales bacterium]|nr:hypothetical protein [Caldilineales bacterium]
MNTVTSSTQNGEIGTRAPVNGNRLQSSLAMTTPTLEAARIAVEEGLLDPQTGEIIESPVNIDNVLANLDDVGVDHDARLDWALANVEVCAHLNKTDRTKVKTKLGRGEGKLTVREQQDWNSSVNEHVRKLAKRQTPQQASLSCDNTSLTSISTSNRPLRDQTNDAIAALQQFDSDKETLFVRSGDLVRVRTDENERPVIETVTSSIIISLLARSANFIIETQHGPKHISPPKDVANDILALGEWPFPPLEAIVEAPILRPDGSILDQPGYDQATRFLYRPAPDLEMPEIPDTPSQEDVENALATIDEAIGDFPFVDNASCAAALALFLTLFVHPLVNGNRPIAIIEAPAAGTGKTLLANAIGVAATGRDTPMMSDPLDGQEWRKSITSALRDGSSFCVIDNVDGKLDAPELARVATAEVWRDRILGKSEQVDLPNRAIWVVTGNNIRLGGDLPRRCFLIRLDAGTATPWLRGHNGFRHPDLIAWIKANRGKLVSAALILAKAWVLAGRPKPRKLRELGSFENWCYVLGGILENAGVPSFFDNLQKMYEQSDEDGPLWEAFLAALYERFGDKPITVADLATEIVSDEELQDALPPLFANEKLPSIEVNSSGDEIIKGDLHRFKHSLGRALAGKRDAYYGPYSIQHAGQAKNKARRWRVITSQRGDREIDGDTSLSQPGKNNYAHKPNDDVRAQSNLVNNDGQQPPLISESPHQLVWEEGEI